MTTIFEPVEQFMPREERQSGAGRVASEERGPRRWRAQLNRLIKMSEAQTVLSWAIVFFLAVTIATLYVTQASRTAEVGRYIQDMRIELQTLRRQNGVIEQQIAKSQSLTRLQTRSTELGFILADPANRLYVTVDNYPIEVEPVQIITPPPPPAEPVIESMEEALWNAINERLLNFSQGNAGPVGDE